MVLAFLLGAGGTFRDDFMDDDIDDDDGLMMVERERECVIGDVLVRYYHV